LSPSARKHIPEQLWNIVESETLTPFMAEAIDIAYVMAFLASDESRNITGQNLVSDGGTSCHVPGFSGFRPFFQGE
jgi:NAD(P)-dependent dehydrogenase (short-subunit alcohol dehydrogenase family)